MSRLIIVSFAVICSLLILSTVVLINAAKAGGGVIYILGDGLVLPSAAPIYSSDNSTYFLTSNITALSDGIIVQRNNVVLDGMGYTVFGDGSGNGVDLVGTSNVTVRNVNIEGFACGIYIANYSEITDAGNDSLNSSQGTGETSFSNIVTGNNITANYGDGVRIDHSLNDNLVENNISANGGRGVYFYYSTNGRVSGNNVTDNVDGIGLDYSMNNSVYGNIISANAGDGVTLGNCSGNNFYANNISSNNAYGVHFDSSINDSIFGNYIAANEWNGVRLDSCSTCYVGENNITANTVYGVGLCSSSNNSISSNDIANNGYGVGFDASSDGNNISGNNLTENYGHGIGLFASSNNTIFHNNIVDNKVQAYCTSDSTNFWDDNYPYGGNYWSDYNGTDLRMGPYQNQSGSDGIGDIPYVVDSRNQDNFPLVGVLSDFKTSSQSHLQTVSNSTIANLTLIGTEISFNASGPQNATGFCRISLPTNLNISQFTVSVNGKQITYIRLPESESNETFLYFTYSYPTQEIPEFSPLLILALLLVCSFLTGIICKKSNYEKHL